MRRKITFFLYNTQLLIEIWELKIDFLTMTRARGVWVLTMAIDDDDDNDYDNDYDDD